MSQDELNVQLFRAARDGNIEQVKSAINQGANVNYHIPYGFKDTPLHEAAWYGYTEVATVLISNGADPNAVNENKWTPLHWAARIGNTEVATVLISNGADPNAVDEFKWTPLHWAARNGNTDVVTVLINKGANPNAVDEFNATPLHLAAYKGYSNTAHTLIKAGALLDAIDKDGLSPLHDACRRGKVDCVEVLLLCGADANIKNNKGQTPADMVESHGVNKDKILQLIDKSPYDYTGLLHKALKEGRIRCKYSKLSLSGAPGTGKSSILKLLLNLPPPTYHHSTSVATAPEVRRVETTSLHVGSESTDSSFTSQFWEEINTPNVKRMIAKAIKIGVPSSPVNSTTQNVDSNNSSDDDGSQEETPPDFDEVTSVSPSKPTSPPVSQTANEIAEIMPTVKESSELFNSHWIYCVDSGGQAAFLDIAPAILRYSPVNILTQKLNEKLEGKPKFFFSFNGRQIGAPVERQITNLKLIESSFRSLTSIDQPNLRKIHIKFSHPEPSVLVLGTFFDKIAECKGESLKEKNARLWSSLCQFRGVHMNYSEAKKEIIFPVNTTSRGEPEMNIAERIRTIVCRSYFEAEIPARWFLFKLELEDLQKINKSMVVSKRECLTIGLTLEMDQKDVEASLLYYHDLTIFLYFPAILPNVVFLHPQPLFNKLSEVISISFADAVTYLEEMKIVVPANTHHQLKAEGIFTRDLLDCLPEGFSLDFTADDFLKLMEDILIIASLPEKGKFFLPCVLPTTSKLENIRSNFTKVTDALVLTWDMKPVPQGIFPALVVNLVKHQKSPKFDLFRPPTSDEPSEDLLQYRNAIQLLCLDLGGAILLVDTLYSLDVYYTGLSENCSAIRNALFEGIEVIVKKFQYKPILSSPQEYFYCSICSSSNHLCRPDDNKKILTCCRNPQLTAGIDHLRQLPWIAKGVVVEKLQSQDNKPEKHKLLRLLSSVNAKWQEIGDLLGVDSNTIDGLCCSNYSDQVKMSKMLQSWLDNEPTPATWDNIIDVIDGPLQNKSLATEICQFLGKESKKPPNSTL